MSRLRRNPRTALATTMALIASMAGMFAAAPAEAKGTMALPTAAAQPASAPVPAASPECRFWQDSFRRADNFVGTITHLYDRRSCHKYTSDSNVKVTGCRTGVVYYSV